MKYSSANITKSAGAPIGVVLRGAEVCMLVRIDKKTTSDVRVLFSSNGVDFVQDKKKVKVETLSGKKENIKICDRFSISRTPNGYVMTYLRLGKTKEKNILVVARGKDIYEWAVKAELPVDDFHHTTSVYNKEKDNFELYRDGLFVRHQSSATLSFWKEKPGLVFTSRNNHFDPGRLSIIGSLMAKEGIVLFYDASVESKSKILLQAGVVILDVNDPKKIIWRSTFPIWQAIVETKKKTLPIKPLGLVSINNKFLIYWITFDGGVILATVPATFKELEDYRFHPKILNRFEKNPIIEPRDLYLWEKEGTFNPAVVEDDEGTIHLLYRAIGIDGISRIGYAKSKDGMYFTKRSATPVFEPVMGYGLPDPKKVIPAVYNPVIYTSGGGWGGAEDPRLVRIDDTVYMTYVAFEGWGSMRIALTSISLEDFKAGKWKWKKPTLISPPNRMAKNWLIFPEKIHGKYAIFHGLYPKILIDYVDDLDNIKKYIYSERPQGAPQPGRKNSWDGLLRGAGPPPIKTEMGWLLLYHAIDTVDQGKYKLGAMILDLEDPTKILYRSKHPILSPDMDYENDGKPGVVYASGALIRDDDLYIYYGGADRVVCVATTPLKKLLKYLVTGNSKSYKLSKI